MIMQFDTAGLGDYLTDKDLESEIGVWLRFPGDRRFRVLRAGGTNRRFIRAFQAALRPYRRGSGQLRLDPEESDRIMRETYARHVVVDWKGVKDADGNEVPYTEEAAIAFFEQVPELFSEIVALASDLASFSQETIEEAKRDLGKS